MCPAWVHFIFLTLLIISDFCALPDPDVGNSILVVDIEHISFHFGLCGRRHPENPSSQCVVTHPLCTRDHWIRYDTCTV